MRPTFSSALLAAAVAACGGENTARILPPANVKAVDEAGGVRVQWTDSFEDETGFSLTRKVDSGTWMPLTKIGANVSEYLDDEAPVGSTVAYRVSAVVGDRKGEPSLPASIKHAASEPADDVAAPTDLAVRIDGSSLVVTWKNAAADATGVEVARKLAPAPFSTWKTLAPDATTVTDPDAGGPEDPIAFRVRALKDEKKSPWTTAVRAPR